MIAAEDICEILRCIVKQQVVFLYALVAEDRSIRDRVVIKIYIRT